MKTIQKALFLGFCLCCSMAIADEKPVKGDIRVFNAAFTTYHLNGMIMVCEQNGADCDINHLVAITKESPVIGPGFYYTYSLNGSKNDLEGKPIFLKMYSKEQQKWYSPVEIIKSYNSHEDPFYQFVCWDRSGPQPPYCSSGSDMEVGGD